MKPEDAALLVVLSFIAIIMVVRTIAACGVWSNLAGIRKELKRGNDRAGRFCDMSEYHNQFNYYDFFGSDYAVGDDERGDRDETEGDCGPLRDGGRGRHGVWTPDGHESRQSRHE